LSNFRTPKDTLLLGLVGTIISALALCMRDELSQTMILVLCVSALLVSILALYTEYWNPAFVLRFILLGAPGIIPSLFLLFSARGTQVMTYALKLQTPELAMYVLILSCLALNAHVVGWSFGILSAVLLPKNIFQGLKVPVLDNNFQLQGLRFFSFSLISIFAGTAMSMALGPFIWDASYTAQGSTPLLGLGSINFFIATSVLGMMTLLIVEKRLRRPLHIFLFIAVFTYSLMFCMLFRGMRAEFVGVLFSMFCTYSVYKQKRWSGFHILGGACVGYLFIYTWGAYRAAAASGFSLLDSFEYINRKVIATNDSGNTLYQLGTFGDIGATIFDAIKLIETKTVTLIQGKTYLDFILRTPPEFLYPDRPRDTSYLFFETATKYGGGISEIAEAYFNFSDMGCFIIPFIISSLIGFVFQKVSQNKNYFGLLLFAVIVAAIFRGTMYQSFVFYRSFTVMIFLYFVIEFFWKTILKIKPNLHEMDLKV